MEASGLHSTNACIEMSAPISVWSRLCSFPSQVTQLSIMSVNKIIIFLALCTQVISVCLLCRVISYFSVSQLGNFGSVTEKVKDGRKASGGSTFSLVAWVQGIFYISQLLCCGFFYWEDEQNYSILLCAIKHFKKTVLFE